MSLSFSALRLASLLITAVAATAAQQAHSPSAEDVPQAQVLEGGLRRSRALVIALHGGSWKGDTPSQLAERTLAELSAPARRAGLRLLVPCAPEVPATEDYRVPWLTPAGEALVLSLLDAEVSAGRAARDRLYLAGHGAGATGALALAGRNREAIAAVAVWSGTPEPLWDEQRRVVGLADDVVGRLSAMPVYLWTGSDDRALDADALGLFVTGLRSVRHGPAVRSFVWEQDEGGHGYGPAGPERGLRFLLGHRLPREQRRHGTRPG